MRSSSTRRAFERLAGLLAEAVRELEAEILCGPATGGLIVAQWTAHALGLNAIFAEHDAQSTADGLRGKFVLRRGYDRLVANRSVLLVDDVINRGHSLRQTAQAVKNAGGQVAGAAALVHRGMSTPPGLAWKSCCFCWKSTSRNGRPRIVPFAGKGRRLIAGTLTGKITLNRITC